MVSPVDYYAALELASPEVLYVVVIVLWRGVVRQSEVKVGHLASIPERPWLFHSVWRTRGFPDLLSVSDVPCRHRSSDV